MSVEIFITVGLIFRPFWSTELEICIIYIYMIYHEYIQIFSTSSPSYSLFTVISYIFSQAENPVLKDINRILTWFYLTLHATLSQNDSTTNRL